MLVFALRARFFIGERKPKVSLSNTTPKRELLTHPNFFWRCNLFTMRPDNRWCATVLVSSLCALAVGGGACAAPQLTAPRTAAYPGYTRLVVDVPAGVTYRLEPLGAVLRVTFPGTAFAVNNTVNVGKPELSGYSMLNGSGNAVLNIVTPQGVGARSGFSASRLEASAGKSGYRLVLDVSGAYADTTKLLNPPALRLPGVPPRPLTVVLDPGHGGPDSGALGNGLREDSFNLGMAQRVRAWLERGPGVRVELTRTDNTVFSNDKRTDLNARAQTSRGKTLFVSLHANAVPRASWNSQYGIETYYWNPAGARPQYVPALPPVTTGGAASSLNPPVAPQVIAPQSAPSNAPDPNALPSPLDPPPVTTDPASGEPASLTDPATSSPTVSNPTGSSPAEPTTATPPDGVPTGIVTTPDAPLDPAANDPSTPTEPATASPPGTDPNSGSGDPQSLFTPAPATIEPTAPAGITLSLPGFDRVTASRRLASSVQSRLLFATSANNRGVRSADFYVIKYSESPAILVEMGFVTHPVEAQMLKNPNYLERVSYGVASGITAYLGDLLAAP
jgi:N-acetylmuramoyl-L-alanine amidase